MDSIILLGHFVTVHFKRAPVLSCKAHFKMAGTNSADCNLETQHTAWTKSDMKTRNCSKISSDASSLTRLVFFFVSCRPLSCRDATMHRWGRPLQSGGAAAHPQTAGRWQWWGNRGQRKCGGNVHLQFRVWRWHKSKDIALRHMTRQMFTCCERETCDLC